MPGIPESEAGQIWTAMREARIRALYFGEMAARYARRRQVVQGLSLAFASGAFITLVREPWPVVAAVFTGIVAAANIWSAATNLDQTLTTLVTLRTSWEALRIEYSNLWSNWYADGAAARFDVLQRRGNDLGMLANSGAPWDKKAVARWEEFVDSELSGEVAAWPAPTE